MRRALASILLLASCASTAARGEGIANAPKAKESYGWFYDYLIAPIVDRLVEAAVVIGSVVVTAAAVGVDIATGGLLGLVGFCTSLLFRPPRETNYFTGPNHFSQENPLMTPLAWIFLFLLLFKELHNWPHLFRALANKEWGLAVRWLLKILLLPGRPPEPCRKPKVTPAEADALEKRLKEP